MMENKIFKLMKKADPPLFQRLLSFEQTQAADEFEELWSIQKQKVSKTINRRMKVKSNLSMQHQRQQAHNQNVLSKLETKMQQHTRKKSQLQLQKIKTYRNIDRQWKNKVKEIAKKERKQSLKSFEKSKELNKAILQFFDKRNSPHSSKYSQFRPVSQSGQTSKAQLAEEKKQKSQRAQPSNFLTQIRVSFKKDKIKQNDIKSEFPYVERKPKFNTLMINRKQSIKKYRNCTQQVMNPEILRSRRQKQKKEESVIQHAMQKVQKIMKARQRINEKLKEVSKNVKQQRQFKQSALHKKDSKSLEMHSPRKFRRQEQNRPHFKINRSITEASQRNSQTKLRHEEREAQSFRLRTELYGEEKFKQHRGRFHRMVRDAVNMYRLQTLRQKS